ncbi:hypothetical protein JYT71_00340 [Acidimicrobiaceae bacterium AH-315-P05]|nr:hypothetical protein [Acidimicrobiaceae bacterium AH-315-P05]
MHERDGEQVVRKAGIMGVVLLGGVVRPGDKIEVSLAPGRTETSAQCDCSLSSER